MLQSLQSEQIWSIVLTLIAATAALTALLVAYVGYRRGRYDFERQRIQLDMMRQSMERDLYAKSMELTATEARWRDLNHLLISRLNTQPDLVSQGGGPESLLRSYGIDPSQEKAEPDLIFVLTPFNEDFNPTYDTILKACSEIGLRAIRGDEQRIVGDLLPHILRLILRASIIIANVDGRNPNVFYELGIAHALGKVTILLTRSLGSTPIDLRSKKLVVWSGEAELREKLLTELSRSLVNLRRANQK